MGGSSSFNMLKLVNIDTFLEVGEYGGLVPIVLFAIFPPPS